MSAMENSKHRVAVGIDPGKGGSMAVVLPRGIALSYGARLADHVRESGSVYLVPFCREAYIAMLRLVAYHVEHTDSCLGVACVVEHVGGMPGQSAPASFTFGENAGFIHGALETLEIPYELVRPAKWKKEFSCTSDKNTSIEVAKRLFPGVSLKRTPRCTKDDDGHAEALLMAEYARRRLA